MSHKPSKLIETKLPMKAFDKLRQKEKSKLIVFSPLPPVENGIADYCAELLPELSEAYNLVLVVDNHVPLFKPQENWSVIHLAEYLHREDEFAEAPHPLQTV